jgi:L-threonylcarbamoyladenylate synthase
MIEEQAITALATGGVIAYPTEGVYGLGCDPDNIEAIEKLLAIKQRSADKGLILIAANYGQLLPYVDDTAIPQDKRFAIFSRWPAPVTQLLPASKRSHELITGKFSSVAVRVTAHPTVIALCKQWGKPLISTSANLAGQPSLTTYEAVEKVMGDQLSYIVKGETLGLNQPSTIIDAITGKVLRP